MERRHRQRENGLGTASLHIHGGAALD
jgi:hypothetical protein